MADAQQAARSRHILEHHHWRFTLKNRQVYDFNGIAVVKRAGAQRVLEMRTVRQEQQINLSEIAAAEQVGERVVLGSRSPRNFTISFCIDPDLQCSGEPLPNDLGCDPTVFFCCPAHGAFGTSVPCANIPVMPQGVGCEYDEACGDDGSGNAFGVAFLPWAYRYCWHYFATYDTSCFLGTIPFFSSGENLFRHWDLQPPNVAVLLCKPPSMEGWGFANYADRGVKPAHYGFERKHVLGRDTVPDSIISWTYPNDFLFGRFPVTSEATLHSRYYRTTIPISFPGNNMGFCNFDNA